VRSEQRVACSMLWVTMTMVYWRCSLVMSSSILSVASGSSAAQGSSISRISGWLAMARAMHKPLLLAAGKPERGVVQAVLHLVPQRGGLERALDGLIQLRFARAPATRRLKTTFS
jgi:hypothetical protein